MAGEREIGNVVDFLAERIRRARSVASLPASFEAEVKKIMSDATGLDYSEVRSILYGNDEEFMRSAHDRGQTAKEFVDWSVVANGLAVNSDKVDREDVRRFNESRVAILEFVDENRNDGWTRGIGGVGYKEIWNDNDQFLGVALMQPIKKKEWGFGIATYGVDALDNEGSFIAGSEPVRKFGGYDIEDVVAPLQQYEIELNSATALAYGR